jgi:hypothetical protein
VVKEEVLVDQRLIRYPLIVFSLAVSFLNIKNTIEIFKTSFTEFYLIAFLMIIVFAWIFVFLTLSPLSPLKKIVNFEYNGDDVYIYHGYPIPMGYFEIRTGYDFVFTWITTYLISFLDAFLIFNILLFPIVFFSKCLILSCF